MMYEDKKKISVNVSICRYCKEEVQWWERYKIDRRSMELDMNTCPPKYKDTVFVIETKVHVKCIREEMKKHKGVSA